MTEDFRRDVRAFLASLAYECAGCLRRNQGHCEACYSRRAKTLLERLDRPSGERVLRRDIVSRMARIVAILSGARRPLLSSEIDMANYCSRSGKEFTLREMMRLGKIGRRRVGGGARYVYFIRKQHNTTKGQTNG